MNKLYKTSTFSVKEVNAKGTFLDGGSDGLFQLLETTENVQPGDQIEAFVYRDNNGIIVATTATPTIELNGCAYLKVVSKGDHGAFLDWGLPKDLLLPYSEQSYPVREGEFHTVFMHLDTGSRPVATMRLHQHLNEFQGDLVVGDAVDLLIADESDLGFKAVINDQQLGLIYHDELSMPLVLGNRMKGWVQHIREDGKIDLNVNTLDRKTRDHLEAHILKQLQQCGGRLELSDKSSPEAIFLIFKVSKKNFKSALGSLYKQRLIKISPGFIEMVQPNNN